VIIAAAAANPMTVLRIVLTPLLLEKSNLRRKLSNSRQVAACGARCPRRNAAVEATEPFAVTSEKVRAGGKLVDVGKVLITAAGQAALAGEG
jgi:hypothetical protein